MRLFSGPLGTSIVALVAAACASPEDMGAVEAAAATFHAQLAAGNAKSLHEGAADAYKQATSFEQSERLVAFFQPRLAPCDAPKRVENSVSTNYSTSGNFVTVVYERKCPIGPIVETLTFQIKDGAGTLAGFNISGDQIMVDPAPPTPTPAPENGATTPTPAPAESRAPI